jgi:VanZ family protein
LKRTLRYHKGTIAWSLFVLVMMFMPTQGIDNPEYASLDKLVHVCSFAMLGYLTITGLVKQFRFSSKKLIAARYGTYYAMLFGIGTELGQYYLGYRSFDGYDLVANLTGALIGFVYFQFWISRCLKTPYNLST